MMSMMASTIFGVFGRKRKRNISGTSSEATSTGSSIIDDPEVFFASPSKKRARHAFEFVPVKNPSESSFCQLVDEDVSFKITDPVEFVDNNVVEPVPEPRRSPNGYILPDPLPEGLVLTDLVKGRWRIGNSVGLGGFGEIYSVASWNEAESRFDPDDESYVVKVEPHSNGPLFVERNFYLRAARPEMLSSYKEKQNLEHLGIPRFVASGSFYYRDKKLRFLVMPRFGADLQSVLDNSGRVLSTASVTNIARQAIDSYEYLHTVGWVHKDLKGSNLLFSLHGPADGKVFLVDFGLASKLNRHGFARPNVPDPRSAHEGTLEYCSRDAHRGCTSRRGDFEVLLFNVIDWLGGKLPWDKNPQPKPTLIQEMKETAFSDIKAFLKRCFKSQNYPAFVETLMNSVSSLQFHDTPDYNFFKSIFPDQDLSTSGQPTDDDEVILCLRMEKTPIVASQMSKPSETSPKKQRVKKVAKRKGLRQRRGDDDAPKVAPEPEETKEKDVNREAEAEKEFQTALAKFEKEHDYETMKNPTPAMLLQIERMKNRVSFEFSESFSGRRNGGRRRRRRSGRQRRRSSDSGSSTSDKDCFEISAESPRSPKRPLMGIRIAAVQRSVDKSATKATETRKRFDHVGGFFANVSKSLFNFKN